MFSGAARVDVVFKQKGARGSKGHCSVLNLLSSDTIHPGICIYVGVFYIFVIIEWLLLLPLLLGGNINNPCRFLSDLKE